jgi:hypothetical protein
MTYLADLTRFDASMTQVWTRPVEACLRWQANMLKAAEPVAMGWFERQRVATEAALTMLDKLSHCGDFNEAVSIQREWFDGAVKRLTADFEMLAGQATSLSREAVAATRDAAQSVSEVLPLSKHWPGQREAQIDAAA